MWICHVDSASIHASPTWKIHTFLSLHKMVISYFRWIVGTIYPQYVWLMRGSSYGRNPRKRVVLCLCEVLLKTQLLLSVCGKLIVPQKYTQLPFPSAVIGKLFPKL